MFDYAFISQEARILHDFFETMFFTMALSLLLVGVVIEYFKIPLGGMPSMIQLISRTVVATILLVAYPEISNFVTGLGDAIVNEIGGLATMDRILERTGELFKANILDNGFGLSILFDGIVWLVAFIAWNILYLTIFFIEAAMAFSIIILFVFSPVLIALFILPSTAGATRGLFRTLFEVVAWKVVVAVLVTLLWSTALTALDQPSTIENFIVQIALILTLALSILLTPLVVSSLLGKGISNVAAGAAGLAMSTMSMGLMTPQGLKRVFQGMAGGGAKTAKDTVRSGLSRGKSFVQDFRFASHANRRRDGERATSNEGKTVIDSTSREVEVDDKKSRGRKRDAKPRHHSLKNKMVRKGKSK